MKRENVPEAGGYFYIMMSMSGVPYVGSTENLIKRVWEHKEKVIKNSFTSKYNVNKLVYFEKFVELYEARNREYQIKKWSHSKKIKLIKTKNPLLVDLAKEWFED